MCASSLAIHPPRRWRVAGVLRSVGMVTSGWGTKRIARKSKALARRAAPKLRRPDDGFFFSSMTQEGKYEFGFE
jgi:hypothetical protein